MKSELIVAALLLVLGAGVSGCATSTASGGAEQAEENKAITHKVTEQDVAFVKSQTPLEGDSAVLYVNGMGCPLCASNLDIQLLKVKGVSAATIDLGAGTARVSFEGQPRPSAWALSNAVADAGFSLVRIEPIAGGGGK